MNVKNILLLLLFVNFSRLEPKIFYRDCESGSTAVEFSGKSKKVTVKRPPNIILYSTNENVFSLNDEKWTVTVGSSSSSTSAKARNGIYYYQDYYDCSGASKWANFQSSATYKFSYSYLFLRESVSGVLALEYEKCYISVNNLKPFSVNLYFGKSIVTTVVTWEEAKYQLRVLLTSNVSKPYFTSCKTFALKAKLNSVTLVNEERTNHTSQTYYYTKNFTLDTIGTLSKASLSVTFTFPDSTTSAKPLAIPLSFIHPPETILNAYNVLSTSSKTVPCVKSFTKSSYCNFTESVNVEPGSVSHGEQKDVVCDLKYACTVGSNKFPDWVRTLTQKVSFCDDIPDLELNYDEENHQFTLFGGKSPSLHENCEYKYKIEFDGRAETITGSYSGNAIDVTEDVIPDGEYKATATVYVDNSNIDSKTASITIKKCFDVSPSFAATIGSFVRRIGGVPETGTVVQFTDVSWGKNCKGDEPSAFLKVDGFEDIISFNSAVQSSSSFSMVVAKWNDAFWGNKDDLLTKRKVTFYFKNSEEVSKDQDVTFCSIKEPVANNPTYTCVGHHGQINFSANFLDGCSDDKKSAILTVQNVELVPVEANSLEKFLVPSDFFGEDLSIMLRLDNSALQTSVDLSKQIEIPDPKCYVKSVEPISPKVGQDFTLILACSDTACPSTPYYLVANFDDGTNSRTQVQSGNSYKLDKDGVFWIEYTPDKVVCETNKYRISGNTESSVDAIKLISPLSKLDKAGRSEQLFVFEIDTSKLTENDIKEGEIQLIIRDDNKNSSHKFKYNASKKIIWKKEEVSGSNFSWDVKIGNVEHSNDVKVCKEIISPDELKCVCKDDLCTFSWKNPYENIGNPYMELTLENDFISEGTVRDTSGRVSGNKFIKRVEFHSDSSQTYSTEINMSEIFQMAASPIGTVTASVANICGSDAKSSSSITFEPCLTGVVPDYPIVQISTRLSNELYVNVKPKESYKNICGERSVTVIFDGGSLNVTKTQSLNASGLTKVSVDEIKEVVGNDTSGSMLVVIGVTVQIHDKSSEDFWTVTNLCFDVNPVNELQKPTSDSNDPYVIYPNLSYATLDFPFEKKIPINNCKNDDCIIQIFDKVDNKLVGNCGCDSSVVEDVKLSEGKHSLYIKETSGSINGESTVMDVSICKLKEISKPVITINPSRKYYSPPFTISCSSNCDVNGCVNNNGEYDPCVASFDVAGECDAFQEGTDLVVQAAANGEYTFSCSVVNNHLLGYYGKESKVPKSSLTVTVCNLESPGDITYVKSSIEKSDQSTDTIYVFEQKYNKLNETEYFTLTVRLPTEFGSECNGGAKKFKVEHSCDGEFDASESYKSATEEPGKELTYQIRLRNETDVFFGMVTCKVTVTNNDMQTSTFNYIFVLCDDPKKSTENMYPNDNEAIVKTSVIFKWDPLKSEDVGRSCNVFSPSRSINVTIIPESVALSQDLIITSGTARESVRSLKLGDAALDDYTYCVSFRAHAFDVYKTAGKLLEPVTKYLWQTRVYNGEQKKDSPLFSFETRSTSCEFCDQSHATCTEDDFIDKATCECHSGYKGSDCSQKELTVLVSIFVPIVVVIIVIAGIVIAFLMWRKARSERLPRPDFKALRLLPVDPKVRKDDTTAAEQLLLNDPKFMFARTHELIESCGAEQRLLTALYYAYAKQGCDLDFLRTILAQEISEGEQTIDPDTCQSHVQDKTAGTILYGLFCRLYGLEFMWSEFHKLLEKFLREKKKFKVSVKKIDGATSVTLSTNSFTLSSDNISAETNAALPDDDEPENQALYIMYSATRLVSIIADTQKKCVPAEFASLFAGLRKDLIEVDLKEDVSVHLLLLFIQKFIMPVLVSGYLGVYPTLDSDVRNQLKYVSKVLSKTIWDQQFEEHPSIVLFSCNPFIDQNADRLRSAILNICDSSANCTSMGACDVITNELYQNCLQVIQEFLDNQGSDNFAALSQDSAEAFKTPTKQNEV